MPEEHESWDSPSWGKYNWTKTEDRKYVNNIWEILKEVVYKLEDEGGDYEPV